MLHPQVFLLYNGVYWNYSTCGGEKNSKCKQTQGTGVLILKHNFYHSKLHSTLVLWIALCSILKQETQDMYNWMQVKEQCIIKIFLPFPIISKCPHELSMVCCFLSPELQWCPAWEVCNGNEMQCCPPPCSTAHSRAHSHLWATPETLTEVHWVSTSVQSQN